MSRSTGPILAMGGIVWANRMIIGEPGDDASNLEFTATVAVSSGIVAMALYGIEKLSEQLAVGIAWLGLLTVLLVRVPPGRDPTPLERVLDWYDQR